MTPHIIIPTRGDVDARACISHLTQGTGYYECAPCKAVYGPGVPPNCPYCGGPLLERLERVTVWDNSRSLDLGVFGRYMAALERVPWADLIYTQDDDCRITKESFRTLVDIQSINVRYGRTNQIVTNMPTAHQANYSHTPEKLLGFGSVFLRSLILPTFRRYLAHYPFDTLLLRECDRVFTGLNWEVVDVVDVGVEHLEHAKSEGRMYREEGHEAYRVEIRNRVLRILKEEGRPFKA